MKITKTEKGITIIALIITIIVLLILAVVAIKSVQNDGILSHAGNMAGTYNNAVANEQQQLDDYLLFLICKGNHTDENNDDECDDCGTNLKKDDETGGEAGGETEECQHTGGVYKICEDNGDGHIYNMYCSTCDEFLYDEWEQHYDENNDGVCDGNGCGASVVCEHNWNSTTGTCSLCGEYCQHEKYDSTEDCWQSGKCLTCGYQCPHTSKSGCYNDEGTHRPEFYCDECNAYTTEGIPSHEPIDENRDGKCDVENCGIDVACVHEYNGLSEYCIHCGELCDNHNVVVSDTPTWYNDYYHYFDGYCSNCGYTSENAYSGQHDNDYYCTICGYDHQCSMETKYYDLDKYLEYKYEGADSDKIHYYTYTCSEGCSDPSQEHIYDYANHNYSNGTCVECGHDCNHGGHTYEGYCEYDCQ